MRERKANIHFTKTRQRLRTNMGSVRTSNNIVAASTHYADCSCSHGPTETKLERGRESIHWLLLRGLLFVSVFICKLVSLFQKKKKKTYFIDTVTKIVITPLHFLMVSFFFLFIIIIIFFFYDIIVILSLNTCNYVSVASNVLMSANGFLYFYQFSENWWNI